MRFSTFLQCSLVLLCRFCSFQCFVSSMPRLFGGAFCWPAVRSWFNLKLCCSRFGGLMRIELSEAEQAVSSKESYLTGLTLAWRAFGKAIGVQVHDPVMTMDGDGSQREPITRRYFHFEEANGDRYLSLGHFGCWDEGAMRSLSPSITYISHSVAPDRSHVIFHGWHRPREASQIIPREPGSPVPFIGKDGLSSMGILIGVMKRRIAVAAPADEGLS